MTLPSLTLSRYHLATFLSCRRRFQLGYLRRLPWPKAPREGRRDAASARGEEFHRLLERHFLGLPEAEPGAGDPQLQLDKPWPLTDDLDLCQNCLYQVFCGRTGAGRATAESMWGEVEGEAMELEPGLP